MGKRHNTLSDDIFRNSKYIATLEKELEIIKNHPAELKPTTSETKIHEKKSTAEKLGRS